MKKLFPFFRILLKYSNRMWTWQGQLIDCNVCLSGTGSSPQAARNNALAQGFLNPLISIDDKARIRKLLAKD